MSLEAGLTILWYGKFFVGKGILEECAWNDLYAAVVRSGSIPVQGTKFEFHLYCSCEHVWICKVRKHLAYRALSPHATLCPRGVTSSLSPCRITSLSYLLSFAPLDMSSSLLRTGDVEEKAYETVKTALYCFVLCCIVGYCERLLQARLGAHAAIGFDRCEAVPAGAKYTACVRIMLINTLEISKNSGTLACAKLPPANTYLQWEAPRCRLRCKRGHFVHTPMGAHASLFV